MNLCTAWNISVFRSYEDNNHFLLICPKFYNLRFILLDSIQTLIIPNNNNIDINIDLLLHGNRSFSYDLNTEIFQAVHMPHLLIDNELY
jgi:hypothetical protein